MAVMNVTKDNFDKEVLENKGVVLIDFWAAWCGPCRMLSPVVDEVAAEETEVKVVKVNVDEQSDLAEQFRVMSIPTLVVMQEGKEIDRSLGVIPKSAIQNLIHR
ncbi:MAG TPA: thioredoxin [Lachnospiraceae bacterium]|nr:thioredoxin [Lachnospiraceae bacterium]